MSTPTTVRVACPKCDRDFKNIESCKTHWNRKHERKHGAFLEPRVELAAPLPDLLSIQLIHRVTTIRDPVDQLNIFNLTHASFAGVPVSHDGLLMFQALYKAFTGATEKACEHFVARNFPSANLGWQNLRQFPGYHGREQFAVTLVEGLHILSTTSCENGRILREEMANITARLTSGDFDVMAPIFEWMRALDPAFRSFLMQGIPVQCCGFGDGKNQQLKQDI